MKKTVFTSFFILSVFILNAQSLVGAWKAEFTQDDIKMYSVIIFSENYQAMAISNVKTGSFIYTNGGSWSLDGTTFTETVEFDSSDANNIGKSHSFEIILTDDELRFKDVGDMVWHRIDNGAPGDLKGAWLISGRMRNGEMQKRDTNRPRKTMKLLSGTRFQWIAYNTETKEFMGTGGGTYTTVDGKYTENIEFFSRDDSRVGASLQFDYELKDGDLHHSGLSSKGQPINEVWSLRKQ